MDVVVVGAGMSAFGMFTGTSLRELVATATGEALLDASWRDRTSAWWCSATQRPG